MDNRRMESPYTNKHVVGLDAVEWIPKAIPDDVVEERHESNWIENLNLKEEKHFDLELGFLVAKIL